MHNTCTSALTDRSSLGRRPHRSLVSLGRRRTPMEIHLKRPTPGDASPSPYGVSQAWKGIFKIAPPTMMMSCKGVKGKSLTVEGDAFGFATTDVADYKQRWIKRSEDPVRKDAFAIVNKGPATGKTIQIPAAAHEPVRLAPYNPTDTSLLWTATDTDTGTDGGYSIIHEFVNTNLVLEAVDLQVVVSNYNGSDNQLWKIELADKASNYKLRVVQGVSGPQRISSQLYNS